MLCFKEKTAYEMRISGWSSDVCSSDLCLPVGDGGSSLPCLVQRKALLQTPALEDRKIDRRADGEEPGIPTVEVVELEGFDADPAFQADSWVEIGFGDADGRRRSVQLGFGALYVRSPVRQFGRQAHRHIGRKRQIGRAHV